MSCSAKTIKYELCTRKAIHDGYCWQHKLTKISDIKIIHKENNLDNVETKENDDTTIKTMCVKIDNLRKEGYPDLEKWMEKNTNLYVGRKGRVFITYPDRTKKIFVYAGSKWGNPFKVDKDNTVDGVCEKYRNYILSNEGLKGSLGELKGKILGCFCDQGGICHAKILKELADKI